MLQFVGCLQNLASLWQVLPTLLLLVHVFYPGRVTSNSRLANLEYMVDSSWET